MARLSALFPGFFFLLGDLQRRAYSSFGGTGQQIRELINFFVFSLLLGSSLIIRYNLG